MAEIDRKINRRELFQFTPQFNPNANTSVPTIQPNLSTKASKLAKTFQLAETAATSLGDLTEPERREAEQFDRQQGAVSAVKYQNDLNALMREVEAARGKEDNPFTSDFINQRVTELQKKYSDGKSKAFHNSFLPQAMHAQEQFDGTLQKNNAAFITEQKLGDITTIFQDRLEETLSVATGVLPHQFGAVRESPDLFDLWETGVEKHREDIAVHFREMLNQAYRDYPDVPNAMINQQFIDVFTNMAISQGSPELLEIMQKQDTRGLSLSDTPEFKKQIDQAKRQAETQKDLKENNLVKKIDQIRTQEVQTFFTDLVIDVRAFAEEATQFAPGDVMRKKVELERDLNRVYRESGGKISTPQYLSTLDYIRAIDHDVPLVSDPSVKSRIELQIAKGGYEIEDLVEDFPSLDGNDRAKLLGKIQSYKGQRPPDFGNVQIEKSSLKKFAKLTQRDEFGVLEIEDGLERRVDAELTFMQEMSEWKKANPDKVISLVEAAKIADRILKDFTPEGSGLANRPEEDNKRNTVLDKFKQLRKSQGN